VILLRHGKGCNEHGEHVFIDAQPVTENCQDRKKIVDIRGEKCDNKPPVLLSGGIVLGDNMVNRFTKIKRTLALAGAAALSAGSFAFAFDAEILIQRALNSPTLTVKYDGANASLVELRINGESFATRAVASKETKGTVEFTVTVTDLKDGDNEVEIRLYDKTGKVLSSQKQNISTDQGNKGPVYITGPKQGETVKGPVEIKIGFGKELKNAFVSFFIDGDHKEIKNTPPYNYVWDTQKESNGWHTVEAWVVDELTNTYKSKQVRVFVNNPGGRTNRTGLGGGEAVVAKGTSQATIEDTNNGIKGSDLTVAATTAPVGVSTPKVGAVKTTVTAKTPVAVPAASKAQPVATKVTPKIDDKVATLKSPAVDGGIPMANMNMVPTGSRIARPHGLPNFATEAATKVLSIGKGFRMEGVNTFSVLYNGRFVEFDVQPRVDEGIPMTPFRHLIEKAGGMVGWLKSAKEVNASADGTKIWFKVGDANAKVNDKAFKLEMAPYIDRGRTIVPLTFMSDALKVNIDFDPSTGHVLITKKDSK
jgi:hypothetical protein